MDPFHLEWKSKGSWNTEGLELQGILKKQGEERRERGQANLSAPNKLYKTLKFLLVTIYSIWRK